MKTKSFLTVCLVLALVATLGWSASGALASPACDSAYVAQVGNVFTVKPNGADDTANIQCAFDAAVAAGAGSEVRLSAGTFNTAQIVVNGFHGKFTGAGMGKTNVTNLPGLLVTTEDPFFLNAPSADSPWPALFAFVDGEFMISDLAIHIAGNDLTTGWFLFGFPYEELAIGIVITGNYADARIERILMEGEPVEDSVFGYNLFNGIYFEGTVSWPLSPLSGFFQVSNSTFRHMGFGTPVANISNATVVISHNNYEDMIIATDAADVQYSNLEFSNNKVSASFLGFDLWNLFATEDVGSNFFIKNNVLNSMIGIAFEQTFGAGNQCLITGNNVANVTDLGVFLGPGTTGCTVIGGNNKTNVVDLGTDNVLVGVNNMGTGVGPDIQAIRNLFE